MFFSVSVVPHPIEEAHQFGCILGLGNGFRDEEDDGITDIAHAVFGKRAARTLKKLGYKNVHAKVGDGYLGWPTAMDLAAAGHGVHRSTTRR